MAESLAEKLKRLAAEKKAAKEAVAVVESTVTAAVASVANDQPVMAVAVAVAQAGEDGNETDKGNTVAASGVSTAGTQGAQAGTGTTGSSESNITPPITSDRKELAGNDLPEQASSEQVAGINLTPTPSSHPLAMQFAEMETALLAADPKFKLILRDVHRTLGKEPELVTQMTEEEISLVVRGLVVFANAEIVEPAKAKAVKAGQAAMKKKAISADDL